MQKCKSPATFSNLVYCILSVLMMDASTAIGQIDSLKYSPVAMQVIPNKIQGFGTNEVKLLDGPFKESQDAEANYLLSLDLNRLLSPYLLEAGLTPKAAGYPGWETETLPGVGLCFYLSGASRIYMMTGQKEFLDRINYILTELELCQQKNDGYLLATKNGKQILARVEKEGFFPEFGNWLNGEATPYYSMEKLFSGLRDAYRICHERKALDISVRLGNWLVRHMSFISNGELQKLMAVEYGGMNWVLADLYADTDDKRFLDLSRRWQDNITVVPAVNGNDVLNGKHANMQFPKFSGLAARYPYTGAAGDLSGARFFWDNVVNHRSYVTGGNSESEYFGPRDSLSKKLSPYTEENCNEYNMLRLTQLLAQIEPRMAYTDYLERTLFNHILASQNPADGKICYYLPLMPGAERFYQTLYESFKCCVVSAMDSYTRHAEYIYSHSESAVFVNLFIASELNATEKGIVIRQETSFPDKDISTLTVHCSKPVKTTISIRNPYWANNKVSIKLNGRQLKTNAAKEGYFNIDRNWQNNDVVEIRLPMTLRTEAMPDDKNMIAFFYGPILLAANLTDKAANDLVNAYAAPALVTGNAPLTEWLKPTGNPLTFTTTKLQPEQVEVLPFYRKKTDPYSVYWQQLTTTEYMQREANKKQQQEEEKKLNLLTVDKVTTCDEIEEVNHHLSGTSTTGIGNFGINSNQCWRVSTTNSFGYDMAVSDAEQSNLFLRFMGRGDYEKWSCNITVDGTIIKTLQRDKDDNYPVGIWTATYSIPQAITKGKKKIRVQFEPIEKDKMQMPRVIEMRILKK